MGRTFDEENCITTLLLTSLNKDADLVGLYNVDLRASQILRNNRCCPYSTVGS